MRHFLHRHRWLTVMVAMLLVVATSGMTLSRMTCLIGGHSIWSIGLMEECCPHPEEQDLATISSHCCDVGQASGTGDPLLGHSGPDMEVLLVIAGATPFSTIVLPAQRPLNWLLSRPPPCDPGDRLVDLGTFLI
jgi:hypothetical protein